MGMDTAMTDNSKPAFPAVMHPSQDHDGQMNGMTLRDYFAGQALAGAWSNESFTDTQLSILADQAYRQADAMLKARESSDD